MAELAQELDKKMTLKGSKKKGSMEEESVAYPLEMSPQPAYMAHRMALFDKLKAEMDESMKEKPKTPIQITLPDGKVVSGTAWETTPMDIAKSISNSLAKNLVIAKVNGVLYDSTRVLEEDATLELLDFDHEEGQKAFWHSSAHVLGEACERHYGAHLCIGPPIEDGFYYEMAIKDRPITSKDYAQLETLVKRIAKEKQPFERLVISKENLLEMFKHNQYKQHIIKDKIEDGTSTTVYRCGPLIDLCRGPHVPHTGRIETFKITKNSSSYFLGNAENDSLQRVYGVSFPDKKRMKEHLQFLADADKRDHRKIGKDQELFFFDDLSPGSCFFLPHGARIYNTLVDFIKAEYRKRGFQEVLTPNIYNVKLWETSGHWQNYHENMFSFECEHETFALKPMNCPGHCIMFAHRERSYRELPLRMGDFGVLHRNELSGALTGLTRVRRFQQDDGHIFCRTDQIGEEISGCLDFMRHVYGIFGFTFDLKLSTRPEKYLGEISVWDSAEATLTDVLNKFDHPWTLNPGDGAFYGPKIDITITDAHRRHHQCATIQLDFQLPLRFDLKYRAGSAASSDARIPGEPDFCRPVIIHRAVLGSVERMLAILTENYGGKWPLWLSPRQAIVVPVSAAANAYAASVRDALFEAGFFADADLGDNKFNKKIRNAEIAQYNYIFVVGAKEAETTTVNVRRVTADGADALYPLQAAIDALNDVRAAKRPSNVLPPHQA